MMRVLLGFWTWVACAAGAPAQNATGGQPAPTPAVSPTAATAQPTAAGPGPVYVVPLHGEVNKAQFLFLRRILKDAERANAGLVVIDMDTPGGSLDAAIEMMDALFKVNVPAVTYVNPNAGSAGALISLSTRQIFMAPVSAIGAAAPVVGTGQDLPETMNDKVVSYYSGYFRSAATRYGYHPDIAEAFINRNKEVNLGDGFRHEKGSVLTLSAQDAVRPVNGKPLLATAVAGSVEEVAKLAGATGALKKVEPAGFEQLAYWLTTLAPLFLLGGIIGTYIEMKTPGFGIPGIVAAFCFLVFFTGHLLAGLAGYEVLVFFGLGLLLVVVELLFFPGVIVVALLGVALMLGSLLWTMMDRYPSDPILPSADLLLRPAVNLGIAAVLAAIAIALLARLLPKTPLFSALVLAKESAPAAVATPAGAAAALVGAEGVAWSDLHPTGRAEIAGRYWDVVTRGEFIAKGSPVRVIAADGMRVVVTERKA